MADEPISATIINGLLDADAARYRQFPTRPSGIFIKAVVDHIKATGQPETFNGLYHGKLPKDAKYQILWKIIIDGKKRPNADMAPCPMCTPNRFLDGVLAWFPDLQIAAVIGHCCADHANDAEREFKIAELKRREEDYLLACLPHLDAKAIVIDNLRSAADEALRIYRIFRKRCPGIQQHLREIKQRNGGRLRVTEVLRSNEDEKGQDYFGPAGFRGRGGSEAETRDHDLGIMKGRTALIRDYNPIKELDHIKRLLESYVFTGDENNALEFIVTMTDRQRHAAVAIMQEIDSHYVKFILRLKDFESFFSRENVEQLCRYGNHPHNHFPFDAKYETIRGRPRITFRHRGHECQVIIGSAIGDANFQWEAATFNKT